MSHPKAVGSPVAGSAIPVREFCLRFSDEVIRLDSRFSYFFLKSNLSEEELEESLNEPVAALPPHVLELLPQIFLFFVPYIEKSGGRRGQDQVVLQRPVKPVDAVRVTLPDGEAIAIASEDRDVGEQHYRFFQAISRILTERMNPLDQQRYLQMIRQELRDNVHGEVDEVSWEKKIALLERQSQFHSSSKQLREYARESLVDTLTLYLHGICCDLDVETGPRQLASRHLRLRLNWLETLYPPPPEYAVFPEELKT